MKIIAKDVYVFLLTKSISTCHSSLFVYKAHSR